MPIEVNSAFPEGAKSTFNSQEKAQIDKFINEVPDKNDTRAINYWLDWGDRKVYLEGWIDKCLAGTGFPPMEGGEWDEKIQYMVRVGSRTLLEKQEEKNRPLGMAPGFFRLLEGGFREFEAGEKSWLYGVSWGAYKKEGSPTPSTHPLGAVPEKIPISNKVKQIIGDRKGIPAIVKEDSPIQHIKKGDKVTAFFKREFELGGLKGAWVKEYDVLNPDGTMSLNVAASQLDFVAIPKAPVTPEFTKDLSRIETRIKDVKDKIAEFQEALVKYPSDREIIERDLTERKAILRALEQERVRLIAIPTAEAGTHPLILEIPIPPPREPRKPKHIPENAVIRTKEKLDNTIKHLGYESISFTQEELDELGKAIPTDIDIINDSQRRLRETVVVPDEELDSRQLTHLKLARLVATEAFPPSSISVYAAIIPPASDRVRTAGIYGTTTQAVYIGLDQLYSGRSAIDTLVHELGHHHQYRQTKEAEDLTPSHAEAMTNIAARVVEEVSSGKFKELLKETVW